MSHVSPSPGWLPRILLACASLLLTTAVADAPGDVRCTNGAWVDNDARCASFVKFAPRDEDTKDARILTAYGEPTTQVRSMALVVGVSHYGPGFNKGSLPAAHADVERLKTFLAGQQFDEIIVLENDAATQEAIDYFLGTYIPKEAKSFQGRARVLFAFSGHGVQDGQDSALALSNAQTTSDASGLYSLEKLQGNLRVAAAASWQTLGLIDACYGGDIFDTGHLGGNPDVYWDKGAYVITAGSKGNLTWTLSDAKGSVFFQALIDGIEQGTANSMPIQRVDPKKPDTIIDYGRVVTQGQALAEATRVIRNVQTGVIKVDDIDRAGLSPPWEGSVMPQVPSPGAFFFLANSTGPKAIPIATAVPQTDPRAISWSATATTRSVAGYMLRGIDVSAYSGEVDWKKVKESGVGFAYVKAAGSRGEDRMLRRNLDQLHIAGLPHGVYLTYDFCEDPDKQADTLLRLVPSGTDMLPVALDVEPFGLGDRAHSMIAGQMECANYRPQGTADNILRVLQRLTAAYGRAPVLYLPRASRKFFDARFDGYARWTADYSSSSRDAGRPKDSIWSIWQYTDREKVPGVPGWVDTNVFAGDRNAFALFAGTANALH